MGFFGGPYGVPLFASCLLCEYTLETHAICLLALVGHRLNLTTGRQDDEEVGLMRVDDSHGIFVLQNDAGKDSENGRMSNGAAPFVAVMSLIVRRQLLHPYKD